MFTQNERNPLIVRGAIVAAVTTLIHVLVGLGVIDLEQERAIVPAVDAVAFLVAILWGRAGVTPNAKVLARVTTEGRVVAGDASTTATGEELTDTVDVVQPGADDTPAVVVPVDPAKLG